MVSTTGLIYTLAQPTAEQAGDVSKASSFLPPPYQFPSDISTLAVKKLLPHSLVLLEDGVLHSTVPSSSLPPWLPPLLSQWNDSDERAASTIADLHIGRGHLVALTTSGAVFTTGDNGSAQRGVGHRHAKAPTVSALPGLSSLSNATVVAIAAGDEHCLALTSAGDLYGWGRNVEGQLFTAPSTPFLTVPTFLASLRQRCAVQVGCRGRCSVVLDALGVLWYAGQGLVRASNPSAPQLLGCPEPLTSFSLGSSHLIALSSSSSSLPSQPTVFVLGDNLLGQLGLLSSTPRVDELAPLPSPTTSPITGVSAGAFSSFLLSSGRLYACGSNQGGKLGLPFQEGAGMREVEAVREQWVDGVECEGDRTRVWVSSRVSRVEPAWLSSAGGVAVSVSGVGLFAHSFPLSVRFTYLTVAETVAAVYDAASGRVLCTSPPLPPVVVPSSDPSAASPVERCAVQVSVDSLHWSPAVPIHVYVPPTFEHASFHPRGVLHTGGSPVHLRAELDPMPYPTIGVRLVLGDDVREVEGTWEAAEHRVTFAAPVWDGVGEARVALSFNGVEWHDVDERLHVYRLEGWRCSKEALSVVPDAVSFHVRGCVLHERLRVKFVVAESAEALMVDGHWIGEAEARVVARAQDAAADEEEGRRRSAADELRARIGRPEAEKDDEEKRSDESHRQQQATLASEDARRSEERRLRYEEENTAWAALSEEDRRGRGRIDCTTPSFLHVGPCTVVVWVCVNGSDWHDSALLLPVDGPRIERLSPNCGPITGDTRVEVVGDGLFDADCAVTLTVPSVSPTPMAVAVEAVEEAKGPPAKANRMAPAALVKPALSPRSARGSKAEAAASPPAPAVIPPITLPATYSAASSSLSFTTAAHGVGVRNASVTLTPAGSATMTSAVAVPFTFYQPPTFVELSPASFLPLTAQDATITAKNLFPTLHARVRLTVRDDPPVPERKASVTAAGKGKAKADDEAVRRAAEDEARKKKAEDDARARPPLTITLPARVRVEGEDEVKSPKGKAVKGKAGKEDGVGALLFTVPVAAAGWEGVGEGEERARLEEMVGKMVDVSVAMNGQQFVATGLTLRYEREVKGKKPTAAADKGKKK